MSPTEDARNSGREVVVGVVIVFVSLTFQRPGCELTWGEKLGKASCPSLEISKQAHEDPIFAAWVFNIMAIVGWASSVTDEESERRRRWKKRELGTKLSSLSSLARVHMCNRQITSRNPKS